MTRQEANLKILEIIEEQIKQYPDLRFNQILTNLKINVTEYTGDRTLIKDNYYEEPNITLTRVLETLKKN